MTSYYFHSANGEKVTATSVQAISKLAQKEANAFGGSVQVYTAATRKSHRKVSMARNPVIEEYAEHLARVIKHAPTKKAPAFSKARNNKGPAGQLRVTERKGRTQLINMGARAKGMSTAQVAQAYRDAGYTVTVMRENPATKASKARKKAAHKKGAYLCFRHGGREQRIKFANKGLAAIAAKDYRAGGYAGVKVIGA